MRINLNQLSVFYLAAKHKSLKEAAREIYVSPPAVTMQIKKLEAWLGFAVFERGQGDLRLTERGRALYAALEPVFGGLDELEQYLEGLRQVEEAELRFGTHHLPANYFIPDLLAYVRARHPGMRVQMELGTQDSLLEKFFQQRLDLVLIIGDPPEGAACKTLHLFDVNVALVVSAAGEFGKIDTISVKDVPKMPLILQQKGTGALRSVLSFLKQHEVEPNILLKNLSSDVIKTFLQKMPSGSFIGRFIVQKELDEGIFHEIKILEGPLTCSFNLVYSDKKDLPPKLAHFLTAVPGFAPSFAAMK